MSLSLQQLHAMIAADPVFANLVNIHGMPRPVSVKPCTDTSRQPTDPCMAANCVNGQMLVMMCDSNNNCTIYKTEPC
jgi:hypothetical protein